MKIAKTVLACLVVLAFVALGTRSARAGDTDCSTVASCGFTGSAVSSAGGTLSLNGHNVTFSEQVYLQGSVYMYVFGITNNNASPLDFVNTFTNAGGGGFGDNLNCPAGGMGTCLNFGVITGSSSVDDTGFTFGPLSLTVNFAALGNGGTFTFYAQSTGAPFTGTFSASDGGSAGTATSSDPVPEPKVLTLLGSLLLVLLLGVPFASRLRPHTA